MEKIKKGLSLIGLTDLEADVYIELLKLKQTKVSELAKITKVTRTQLYPLLEKLVEKGVVEKIENKVTSYKVIEPEELISILKKWKEKQLKNLKDLETMIKNFKK